MFKKTYFFLIAAFSSTYANSMINEEIQHHNHNNIRSIDSDQSTIIISEYKPLEPELLYDKDFLENPEALKQAKTEAIKLRLQKKIIESLPYLDEAIKHGDLQSMIWLGEYYEEKGDLLKAIRWYLLVFHLHWFDTFEHHHIIIKKFNNFKEKYTTLTYQDKNKKNALIKFNDVFYSLSIEDTEKKEIKKFLVYLATPKNNIYDCYIKNVNIFLTKSQLEPIINNDALPIEPNNKKKLLAKAQQKNHWKILNELDELNVLNEYHLRLGFQYYFGDILNIDGSLNYTKTLEHFLEVQDSERNHEFNDLCSEANYILKEFYFEEQVDFQEILDNSLKKQYHEKIKNLMSELSIQENVDSFSNEYKNRYENSNDLERIIQLMHLYKNKILGKDLSKNEKKEKISLLGKNALTLLNGNNNDCLRKGYIYFFTKQYEKARTNFLLALENKVIFDTSIIGLRDAHIQSKEYLKKLEQEKNISEHSSDSALNSETDLVIYEDVCTNSTEEFSNEDLSSNTINESTQKTIITKKLKEKIKINKINYKIQKNYENIKKNQEKFKEKQKKHGIFLNKNISDQNYKNRKILFSSEKKLLSNKQKEIKQQYELLITENEKFQRLIEDIKINPWSGGEGQVELLKHRGSYSRRINHCDRLEYRVNSDGDIIILAVEGHYDD